MGGSSVQVGFLLIFSFLQFQAETENVKELMLMMELELPAESAVLSVRKQNQDNLPKKQKGWNFTGKSF